MNKKNFFFKRGIKFKWNSFPEVVELILNNKINLLRAANFFLVSTNVHFQQEIIFWTWLKITVAIQLKDYEEQAISLRFISRFTLNFIIGLSFFIINFFIINFFFWCCRWDNKWMNITPVKENRTKSRSNWSRRNWIEISLINVIKGFLNFTIAFSRN